MIHPRMLPILIALSAMSIFKYTLRTLLAINGDLEFRQEFVIFDPEYPFWPPYVDLSQVVVIPIWIFIFVILWRRLRAT